MWGRFAKERIHDFSKAYRRIIRCIVREITLRVNPQLRRILIHHHTQRERACDPCRNRHQCAQTNTITHENIRRQQNRRNQDAVIHKHRNRRACQ